MTETPEFSRPQDIASAFRKGQVQLVLEANAAERKAIAARLGLVELRALRADLSLVPWQMDGLIVRGTLTADLSQACVVTLEPVPSRLEEPLEARFLPGAAASQLSQNETLSDPDEPDPPESLPESGVIDLGELVIQHLAVVLDPYPRQPGVAFAPPEAEQDPPAASPFAKLALLKRPPKG